MRLWHGNNQIFDLFDVKEHSEVGMVVATPDKYTAETCGKYLYYLDVHEEKILDTDMMVNEIGKEVIVKTIRDRVDQEYDEAFVEGMYDFIIKGVEHYVEYAKGIKGLKNFSSGYLTLLYISARCCVAFSLGYPVVTIEDGEKTSYIILPGQCLERYLEDA